jgi:hypothetical protein
VHSTGTVGAPYTTATFTLTPTTVGTATSPCGTTAFTLQGAGADGVSRTEVPYGSYTLTVKGSGTVTASVTVGGSSVTAGSTSYTPTTPIVESVS